MAQDWDICSVFLVWFSFHDLLHAIPLKKLLEWVHMMVIITH